MSKTLKVGFVAILLILSVTTINAQKFNAKDIVITGQAWGGVDMEKTQTMTEMELRTIVDVSHEDGVIEDLYIICATSVVLW